MRTKYLLAGGALLTSVYASMGEELNARSLAVCTEIEESTSSTTDVFYPGQISRKFDRAPVLITIPLQGNVRPGTAADIAIIVKGGGHASNPGFSSTTGVHISMTKFSGVTYDADSQTAVIGAGLIWDDVYEALAPYNVNVVGGRVTGVGVAGFTLGGGYSWLTNQYGLTIDTVVAYELVTPTGEIVSVTEASDPDLFFGLKGGMNNFGIVTTFTLQTFPQGQVWGGLITYTFPQIPAISNATANFAASVTDPKAQIITTYNYLLGEPGISQLLFYDGPTPPEGIFDEFLSIPALTTDVSTRDFLSLVQASPSNATYGQRAIFNSVSLVQYTPALMNAIYNETVVSLLCRVNAEASFKVLDAQFWGERLSLISGSFISYDVEPFLPTIFSHGSASAYPPSRDVGLSPFNIYYAWTLSTSDDDMQEAARLSAAQIKAVAIAEGQDISDVAIYPNYAIYDTPLAGLYGANVATLETLKASVDPLNVMGLAGGFKL
ncbi:hypothetical protein H0H92_000430 [Tricholoma furcatifolium]|nr:hypothetical protein H0H92_000430 [Tricholoma furcatifolium]